MSSIYKQRLLEEKRNRFKDEVDKLKNEVKNEEVNEIPFTYDEVDKLKNEVKNEEVNEIPFTYDEPEEIEYTIDEDIFNPEDYISEFKSISFSMFSSEEIRRISVVEIKESKLSGDHTVYDDRLGVLHNRSLCRTCKKGNDKCSGHFGHIELPVPIAHPMYSIDIVNYLNCFCFDCHKLMITIDELQENDLLKLKGMNRLNAILEFIFKKQSCPHCDEDRKTFYCWKEGLFFRYSYYIEDKKKDSRRVMFPDIENSLGFIDDKEFKLLGMGTNIKPVNYIMRCILVLPICARPFVEVPRGTCDDDLTSAYIEIIKLCNKITAHLNKEKIIYQKDFNEVIDALEFRLHTFIDNTKNKSRLMNKRPIKCIRQRLDGKTGQFRLNLGGKRGDFSARSVISPDVFLRADEIGIPEEFAYKLSYPEKVFSLVINGEEKGNIKKLQQMVNEGRAYCVDKKNGQTCRISPPMAFYSSNGFKLQIGDIIFSENEMGEKRKKTVDENNIRSKLIESGFTILRVKRGEKIFKKSDVQRLSEQLPLYIEYTDRIIRNGQTIDPTSVINSGKEFLIKLGDRVLRKTKDGVEELNNVIVKRRDIILKEGDVVHRNLMDGDLVLFGRQPSLHIGSLIARKVKIFKNLSGINNGMPIRTIRLNLAQTSTYNADFDGDYRED